MDANGTVKLHNWVRFQDELLILFQRASDLLNSFGIHRLILIVVERDLCIGLQVLLLEVKLILVLNILNVPYGLFNSITARDSALMILLHFHSRSFDFFIGGGYNT